jgi:hypothetical protein
MKVVVDRKIKHGQVPITALLDVGVKNTTKTYRCRT